MLGCQIFGQNFVLFGRADRRRGVLLQTVDLIDQIIVKAMETCQPPGSGRFFVAAFPAQEVQIFVDILFAYTAPERGIQPFGINVFHLHIIRHKPAAAFHEFAEIPQVAVIVESGVRTFARDHFQIADIFDNIR